MKHPFYLSPLIVCLLSLSGCGLWGIWRVDVMHPYIRSESIDSAEKEKAVVEKASLSWTEDGRIRVLHVRGTPYERGYQQGYLLREEIQDNLGYLYDKAVSKFRVPELLDEGYERMRPFIPAEYVEEMHGLAHGSKMPLRIIQGIHALPEIGEWGGKKKIQKIVKQMMSGDIATSCSNLCASGNATANGMPYTVRVLDWGLHRISKLHEYPLITIEHPDDGLAYANISWAGFLGAVSGMNTEGITLGEMGYGESEIETMSGMPMPFMLREVLKRSHNLKEVRHVIQTSAPTNSFVFLMSDGKTSESELYVRDPSRFLVFKPGEDLNDKGKTFPAIPGIVYGGKYQERMTNSLQSTQGKITPEVLMNEVIPAIVMPSNFQSVIYSPKDLTFWVSNAPDKDTKASEGVYTKFRLER